MSSSVRAAFRGNQESSPCRLRPPSAFLGDIHLLFANSSVGSLSSQRGLQRARSVQDKIIPVSTSRRQPALLAQVLAQESREPSRTMVRSTIYCALHRLIGHHRLGLGVGAATRGHEIECRLVGFTRSVGNDSAQGSQGVSSRLPSECRSPPRPHGQALPGQPGRLWSAAEDVIQVPSAHDRDQGP